MSRFDQHSAFGFLIYYPIYILWTGSLIMDGIAVFLIVVSSIIPDFDIFIEGHKKDGLQNLDESYQHHYQSIMHYPLLYIPFFVPFILSVIFQFYPYYFLIPCLGIYLAHFLFDTIACGDGIMWTKVPWSDNYAPFINFFSETTDGYHGLYWVARYQKTLVNKIGNAAVFISVVLIQLFQILYFFNRFPYMSYNIFYISSIIYLLLVLFLSKDELSREYLKEPPEGRYNDYRIDPEYINGLDEKMKEKHLKNYGHLLEES